MSSNAHHLTTIPYGLDRLPDLVALTTQGGRTNANGAGWWHAGDVVWGMYQNLHVTVPDRTRLICDPDGRVVGRYMLDGDDRIDVHVPGEIDDPAGVTCFAVRAALAACPTDRSIRIEAPSHQQMFHRVLTDFGFSPTGEFPYRLLGQALDRDLPQPRHETRPVRPEEYPQRVNLHCEVWHPSRFTLDGYVRLRERIVYRPDLDLVAVTPEGELAAYGIVWWDPATRTGEFEPVGTAERFRGQGYGGDLVHEGLRRLRELGATRAIVINEMQASGEPARRLYASAGFHPLFDLQLWSHPAD